MINNRAANLLHLASAEKFRVDFRLPNNETVRSRIDTAVGHLAYFLPEDKIISVARVED